MSTCSMHWDIKQILKRLVHQELFWLALIIILAIALRLFFLVSHPLETRDGLSYIEQTRQLFVDGEMQKQDPYLQAPPVMYCYFSKSLMHLGLTAEQSTLLVNFLAGIMLLIPIWLSGKVLFNGDKREALFLTLLAAVFPKLVKYSCERLREGLFLFFSAWTFYLLFYVMLRRKNTGVAAVFCGMSALLAMTCRYEALELVFFCFGSITIGVFMNEKKVLPPIKCALLFLFGLVIGFTFLNILPGFPNLIPTYLGRLRDLYYVCI